MDLVYYNLQKINFMDNNNIDLDLTFCIPVRVDSKYRLRNLSAILRFYSQCMKVNFFILEADIKPQIMDLLSLNNFNNIIYKFIYDSNPIFHRTHYINQMLSEVKTEVAGIWDTDAVAPPEQVMKAYKKIKYANNIMVYPYDGHFWAINNYLSNLFCRTLNLKGLTSTYFSKNPLGRYNSVGGAFLVDVKKYKHCGWENEFFIGWGPEDVERYHRMEILGFSPARIKGSLYHLYHTRGINSGLYNADLMLSTKKEYIHICQMNRIELEKYIKTWNWIH